MCSFHISGNCYECVSEVCKGNDGGMGASSADDLQSILKYLAPIRLHVEQLEPLGQVNNNYCWVSLVYKVHL